MYADIEAAFKQLWQQLRRVQDGRRQEERESGSTPGSELLRYLRDELRGVLRFLEARFSCDPHAMGSMGSAALRHSLDPDCALRPIDWNSAFHPFGHADPGSRRGSGSQRCAASQLA